MPKGWKQSNGSDDDATKEENNDIEQKKWMINILLSMIQSFSDELDATKEEIIIRFQEAYPKTFTSNRNKIIATIAFIATILFSFNDFMELESLKNLIFIIMIILNYMHYTYLLFRL